MIESAVLVEVIEKAGTAGSCILYWHGMQFEVGFGPYWTGIKKQALWNNRLDYEGKAVLFRCQELNNDGAPIDGELVGFYGNL